MLDRRQSIDTAITIAEVSLSECFHLFLDGEHCVCEFRDLLLQVKVFGLGDLLCLPGRKTGPLWLERFVFQDVRHDDDIGSGGVVSSTV